MKLTTVKEIYNYKDLRKELIAKGHKFYTDTDSEVLVHGFEEIAFIAGNSFKATPHNSRLAA